MRALKIAALIFMLFSPLVFAQTVTYSLGDEVDLLDAAFYAGQPEDGSDVGGRMAFWGAASGNGQTVVFLALNVAAESFALFRVEIGDPSSWERVSADLDHSHAGMAFTPDNAYILTDSFRTNLTTGVTEPYHPFGINPWEASVAKIDGADWLVAHPAGEVVLYPILPDGSEDHLRQPCIATQFGERVQWPIFPVVSPDGTSVVFIDWAKPDGEPTLGDTYILTGLQAIMGAPKVEGTDISSLAPTSLSDPRIIDVRASETDNCTVMAHFTQDGMKVIYSEDWNHVYQSNDFFGTMPLCNWDIMVSDATPGGDDYQLDEPLNQACARPTPGGTRLIYIREEAGSYHLYITTLETATTLEAIDYGDPEDNAVITTDTVTATDTASTQVTIPVDTIVDFPTGALQEIQITTPIDLVATPDLPPDVVGIPVLREFGPSGTTFSVPVVVTITYTDAEIEGLNESQLRVFCYNEETGHFDTEILTVFDQDLVHNTISFTVTHFSLIGLGAEAAPLMPVGGLCLVVQTAILALVGAGALSTKRR